MTEKRLKSWQDTLGKMPGNGAVCRDRTVCACDEENAPCLYGDDLFFHPFDI